jgi:hypothetical protein
MKNCPVCNAGYKGGGKCHRCKSDLGRLLAIESRAEKYLALALAALKQNDYEKMRHYARKSCAMKTGDEGQKLAGLYRS